MVDFNGRRRTKMINEVPANESRDYFNDTISEINDFLKDIVNYKGSREDIIESYSWSLAGKKLYLLQLDYSVGCPVETLVNDFDGVLISHENTFLPKPKNTQFPFNLVEPDTYSHILQLLSLAKLLGYDSQVPRFAALLDVKREKNRGIDELYETILDKLGLESIPNTNHIPNKAYAVLLEVIHAMPQKRPKLMAEFLKKWYPSMKKCYWYGIHEKQPLLFSGYWCFEAALVTYLWDIDDSSYRDMQFYPKDLVDWARSNKTKPVSETPPTAIPSVRGGNPCTQEGWWWTPAHENSRKYFKINEPMPDYPGSPYGDTYWQWDDNQA